MMRFVVRSVSERDMMMMRMTVQGEWNGKENVRPRGSELT